MILNEELQHLFKKVKSQLGWPIRPIQIADTEFCLLLETCVDSYVETVQNWIIKQNWLNYKDKEINFISNAADLTYAMSMGQLDFTRDYSYWFSREVGLQQRGSFELKKDFFHIEKGKQCYEIPAGREINKVLYITPPTTRTAMYGTVGTLDAGFGGGYAQIGNIGMTGFYVGSAYDTALLSVDLKYKNSLIRGDLAYKVTAGPNGTHIIHLLSVPGSRVSNKGVAVDDSFGWGRYANCVCWYTYYDVTNENKDLCYKENKNDLVLTPDQVPFEASNYEFFNFPTKVTIQKLLTAKAKQTLGYIRGTFSGEVKIPDAELKMDYNIFLSDGKDEEEKIFTDLKERLEAMLPWNQMENYAKMVQSQIEILKNKPLGLMVR